MNFELMPIASGFLQQQAALDLMACNEYTADFGLVLTQAQAQELVQTRSASLQANGRIEFGGGVVDKIIKAFCDSVYLSMQDYAQTLHELVAMFYYYKNETMDLIADDDLIDFMKSAFDGVCQGSLELLSGRELYWLAANLRLGHRANYTQSGLSEEEENEDG